jgi:hypothetical protein
MNGAGVQGRTGALRTAGLLGGLACAPAAGRLHSKALNAWFCVESATLPFTAMSLKSSSILDSAGCKSSRLPITWNLIYRRIQSQYAVSVRLLVYQLSTLNSQLSTLNRQLLGASSPRAPDPAVSIWGSG